MRKMWAVLFGGALLLTGCGGANDAKSALEIDAPEEATTLATATTSITAETTAPEETTQATKQTLEENITTTITDNSTATITPAMSYEAVGYGCTLDVPEGWSPSDGVENGKIVSDLCVFEPDTPNGDSIALAIQEQADDPDVFALMVADDVAYAYSEALETVSVTEMTALTVDGYAAYRFSLVGSVGSVAVRIQQVIINCLDRDMFYSLTDTDYSGGGGAYTGNIESYIHLT